MSPLANVEKERKIPKEHNNQRKIDNDCDNDSITVTTTNSDLESDNEHLIDMLNQNVLYSSTQHKQTSAIKKLTMNISIQALHHIYA